MGARFVLGGLLIAILVAFCAHRLRDPLRTMLPFGTTDLSSVQAQLQRLTAEERALVEAYVKRSNGDVLPPAFADPDQPFTARTFAEAIALERAWSIKRGEIDVDAGRRQAERDAALAPLRDAVEADVVRAEVLSPRELAAPADPDATVKRALPSDEATVFVVTVALHNAGSKAISGVQGSLEAHDREAYLPLDLCWVDIGAAATIEPASRIEIRCANPNRHASDQQRAFVDDASGRFTVAWYPKRVVFADGTQLDSGL